VARRVATELGWHLLDSGALYRLVGLAAHTGNIDFGDHGALARVADGLDARFGVDGQGHEEIWLSGQEVSASIRTETAGERASQVAAVPGVRSALLDRQHRFLEDPGLVADGRDMGTVVFPAAPLKVFLTASAAERALRRYNQLKDKGLGVSLAALSQEVAERDLRDSSRAIAPLKPAADAVIVDSTSMTVDEVVQQVLSLWAERKSAG
jgi:cytidylate kinase